MQDEEREMIERLTETYTNSITKVTNEMTSMIKSIGFIFGGLLLVVSLVFAFFIHSYFYAPYEYVVSNESVNENTNTNTNTND